MINKRFLPWFALALVLVVTVGVIAFSALKKQAGQEQWVEHTYQIINRADQVSKLIIEMETDQRGYRATGDASYLDHYQTARAGLTSATDSLKAAIVTNAEEIVHIDHLLGSIKQLDQFWQSQTSSAPKADLELNRQITNKEKEQTEKVLADITAISTAAQHLLTKRQLEKADVMQQASVTITVGTILILLVVIALIRLVIIEHKNRTKAELELNDKYAELNQVNDVTSASNWLLDGIRQINNSLMGNDTLDALVQSSLDAMTAYLQLPCAICYTFDKEYQELVYAGSVALATNISKRIKLGEGLTGAAANRKQLTIIEHIPSSYWKITSGSGTAIPDTLIILPLWKANELVGVIEFGCFGQKLDRVTTLLQDMAVNIGLGIAAAQLLLLTQSQRDILETQQEELRQSNDELGMQTEELRASEEDLKAKEEELTLMNQMLEEKTESLEITGAEIRRKAADLERSGKYKSEFLANMSHELRTPLNSILILTALMQENKDRNLSNRQQENLRIVHQSGTDLLNLINDVLDLSKIEAGKVDFLLEDLSVNQLAGDMQRAFTAVAGKKQIRFEVITGDADAISFQTDRQRLGQVIKNLLSNAFKFTPDKGKVTLNFSIEDTTLNISVTDSGVGIAQDKQQLIFDAFQQADGTTTRRFGGTGLGLSISKELVSKLGGRINVESTPGLGSTFTVSLPLTITEASNITSGAIELPMREQTQIKDDRTALLPSQRSILIIEDDVNFARTVNDFAVDRGFKTIIALSGDEGLHYAHKYRPSAIILDLALPVMSGQHILKTIKADPELQHIPVHVISAMDGTGLYSSHVEGFVQKPVRPQDLAFTFSSIETYIRQHYKKVLILSSAHSALTPSLSQSKFAGTIYDITASFDYALRSITTGDVDCLVIDMDADDPLALQQLQQLRAAANVHIIASFNQQLSPEFIKQFQPFANALISPSEQSETRLLDEVELFLQHMTGDKKVQIPAQFTTTGPDNALSGKTILLADDDMRNIYALSALLEEHEMKVLTAEHGKEALDLLAKHPETALVLMDIMMPEMDGYEATRQIRENPDYADLPIIALTAKAMLGDREKCLAAGASDYITKPVSNEQLLSLIRVWLSSK